MKDGEHGPESSSDACLDTIDRATEAILVSEVPVC